MEIHLSEEFHPSGAQSRPDGTSIYKRSAHPRRARGSWPGLSPHTKAGALPFSRSVREDGALAGHRGGRPSD